MYTLHRLYNKNSLRLLFIIEDAIQAINKIPQLSMCDSVLSYYS